MSQAVPPLTEHGYAAPTVRQFGVFLDNKVGKLLELLQAFEESEVVHVRAISVFDSSDHAVVRLICDNADAARQLLRRKQFSFSELDLLVVEIDEKKTLTALCLYLLGAELNIRFAYPILPSPKVEGAVALAVDDHTLAGQILRRKGFRMLAEEELG
ncbi:MAG: acetolactate synthase [Phycisphaerales bacterium]|jgi:hypothetical protein